MTDAGPIRPQIPADLLPADGRFGAGPSKIRTEPLDALAATGSAPAGHLPPPGAGEEHWSAGCATASPPASTCPRATRSCSATVARRRSGTSPRFGLIREKSQHLSFGEFSAKFASLGDEARRGSADPSVITQRPGLAPEPVAEEGVDAYAWAHNETSTAVMAPGPPRGRRRRRAGARRRHVRRRRPAGRHQRGRRLLLRAAEVLRLRRRPLDRAHVAAGARPGRGDRRRPTATSRRSSTCRPRSTTPRKNQTYNTPSVATLFLMAEQLDWMNSQGGLAGMVERTTASSDALYGWAEKHVLHDAVRHRPRAPLAGHRHDRLRRLHRRGAGSPRRCAPTASSTPSPTASSAATSCASRCIPRSTRATCRSSPRRSTGSSTTSEVRHPSRSRRSTARSRAACRASSVS